MPVFLEDTVKTGVRPHIASVLLMFWTDERIPDTISFKVEKVTPPTQLIDTPIRPDDAVDPLPAVQEAQKRTPENGELYCLSIQIHLIP